MQLVLKSPNEAPYEAGKDFSVMISFDDSVAATRADDVLQLLGQNLKAEEGRLFHQWWHVEDLAFTAMRELAALEAAMADSIIIVIHQGRQLTGMIGSWLERVLALRKDRPKALVAILDLAVTEPDAAQGLLSHLKQAAALGQMDFIAAQARLERAEEAARRGWSNRRTTRPGAQKPRATQNAEARRNRPRKDAAARIRANKPKMPETNDIWSEFMTVPVIFSNAEPPAPVAMMPGTVSTSRPATPKRGSVSARAARSGRHPKPDASARFSAEIRRRYELIGLPVWPHGGLND